MPNARPMTNARSGERNAPHASMPGERIARSGNRTD
jgi:hypothetical protein